MKIKRTFLYILLSGAAVGCTKDEPAAFEAKAAVNFIGKSVEYTFMSNPQNEYIQEVPVRIIGDTTSYDRYFKAVVIKDTSTTAADGQYEVLRGVVKRGQFTGVLPLKLRNAPALSTSRIAVKLQLSDTTDFQAGNVESNQFVVGWTNKVVVPSWTYYRYFFTSVASTAAYRLIVQTTGLTTLTASQYVQLGQVGAEALGTRFGDYVKQWNKEHPGDPLKHDDGTQAGKEIVPLYYSREKYN